jgi:hypothetical protein
MARRRRRLTPGEVRIYERFLQDPHPTIKGHFEPLTPTVAHQLAPTVIPAPAPPPVPAGVRIDRYGGIHGGILNVPLPDQYRMNPGLAAQGVVEQAATPGDGGGTPPAVISALRGAGLLGLVEKERHKLVASNEAIHPDVLAEAIANTVLTAGGGRPGRSRPRRRGGRGRGSRLSGRRSGGERRVALSRADPLRRRQERAPGAPGGP